MKTLALRFTIVQRLSALLFGMTLVFGALVAAAGEKLFEQAAESAQTAATRVATNLTSQLQPSDAAREPVTEPLHAANRRFLQEAVQRHHLREGGAIRVVDLTRTIVASSVPAEVGEVFEFGSLDAVGAALRLGKADVVKPAVQARSGSPHQAAAPIAGPSGTIAGVLLFDYSALATALQAGAAKSVHTLVVWFFVGMLLTSVASLTLARRISRDVRQLSTAATDILAGQLDRRVAVDTWDELGDLGSAFNAMTEKLVTANAGLQTELTERRRAEAALEKLAQSDVLTGLANRSLFHSRLDQALKRAIRHRGNVALLFVDLDRFKQINDVQGHGTGDRILQEVAQRLRLALRATDTVARIGGDEFTIILEDAQDRDTVAMVARKLIESINAPIPVGSITASVSASIGVAMFPEDGQDMPELLKQADMAMYQAKADGRHGYAFYSTGLSEAAKRRQAVEKYLHGALERGEVALQYQVRVDARARHLVAGMEALLRWTNPKLGAVAPDEFVSVAEETGLIVALGEWALRTACSQHAAWRAAGLEPGVLAVNVSAAQFSDPNLAETVAAIMAETGMPPNLLELELTESMVTRDIATATASMRRLRALGVGLAIDDFGTGYSSLSQLKHFPLTRLKIDRVFVEHIHTSTDDAAIATAVVGVAKSLNMQITAEGVETVDQLEVLQTIGCDEYQGYLFGRATTAESVERLLAEAAQRSGVASVR